MKRIKKYLAVLLSMGMLLSAMPATAVWGSPGNSQTEDDVKTNDYRTASPGSADREEPKEEPEETKNPAPSEDTDRLEKEEESGKQEIPKIPAESKAPVRKNAAKKATETIADRRTEDQVTFNTGSGPVRVVPEETFDEGEGDAAFEDDGSYTINIPEDNPFFPYEVQFTWDGETENFWFMTPDDSVEVGGYTFYVSAYFDGTAVTQMSLEVGGETVVVYPEEKDFPKGLSISPMSLLPLEERELTVDLTGYTPVELTMVSVDTIFGNETDLPENYQVSWAYRAYGDSYDISDEHKVVDLSRGTTNANSGEELDTTWQMIVGEPDQLAAENLRYKVNVKVTPAADWLVPVVYQKDGDGNWIQRTVSEKDSGYEDYVNRKELYIEVEDYSWEMDGVYLGLQVNPEVFPDTRYDFLEAHNGYIYEPDRVYVDGDPIPEILTEDMTVPDSGYYSQNLDERITLVSYDSQGEISGLLPIRIFISDAGHDLYMNLAGLYTESGEDALDYCDYPDWLPDSVTEIAVLKYGYPANGSYRLVLECVRDGEVDNASVIAAYAGFYDSIEEAQAAGAQDIREQLFDPDQGYAGDYSKETHFSIFTGQNGVVDYDYDFYYGMYVAEGTPDIGDYDVRFTGIRDSQGQYVDSYVVDRREDSYGEYNYLTIMAGEEADLSQLAPVFDTEKGIRLYAEGSSSPEISGESVHDFSDGPVQYTASTQDGSASRNYWVQVIQAEEGEGTLYINSLSDEEAETSIENGVVYSEREIVLDWLHDDQHDILLINKGTEPIPALSVELESEQVMLDEYWTLKGTHELAGFSTTTQTTQYGELPNMAKIRLLNMMDESGKVEGTLTIKSGSAVLAVLTLTGVVGDPGIVTEEIPDAVKYVPYGTMIQNSNMYEWNTVEYRLMDGELPGGMELRPNGELYGVPTESGEFTFTVEMINSSSDFSTSERTFTLTVTENTDANVEAATDTGYELTQRVQDFAVSGAVDQTLVSEGEYSEFVDVFLDGDRLTEGTDYDSEEGSTRITIRSQTFKSYSQPGTHTIGIEFRVKETNTLRRAAQNYVITGSSGSSGGGSSSSSGGSSGGGGSITTTVRDAKKGYVHNQRGIITGDGAGYSKWIQDENGWKLNYADGTMAKGSMVEQADGSAVEQILWEMVNGAWYAFGADEYLKSGWVYDYNLQKWYLLKEENGMQSGWYQDPQDGFTYYLDPGSGELVHGWRQIDQSWYYFNEVVQGRTWELNEETGDWYYNVRSSTRPYGSLYRDEVTPDGYQVGNDGVWKEPEDN